MGGTHRGEQPVSGRTVRKFDKRVMRGTIRLGPNDAPYAPPFSAECGAGHVVIANAPVTSCPAYIEGEACTASLRRFGAGSGRGSNLVAS